MMAALLAKAQELMCPGNTKSNQRRQRACRAWSGRFCTITPMAKLALVYGLRLLPADEIEELGEAPVRLKNGRDAYVTMHLLEGSKEQIQKQLQTSVDAFFDLYPEI